MLIELEDRRPQDGSQGRYWSTIDRTALLPRRRRIDIWGTLFRRKEYLSDADNPYSASWLSTGVPLIAMKAGTDKDLIARVWRRHRALDVLRLVDDDTCQPAPSASPWPLPVQWQLLGNSGRTPHVGERSALGLR